MEIVKHQIDIIIAVVGADALLALDKCKTFT
jgi:hypothetical protein